MNKVTLYVGVGVDDRPACPSQVDKTVPRDGARLERETAGGGNVNGGFATGRSPRYPPNVETIMLQSPRKRTLHYRR
jgi:hypothetical protein